MKLTSLNQLEEKGETFEGGWELDRNHELVYREKKGKKEARFKGPLVAVEPGSLVFSAAVKEDEKKTTTALFKLTGAWRVDPKNRTVFEVERGAGKNDRLTFFGRWKFSRDLELSFEMEYAEGKKRTLTFGATYHFNQDANVTVELEAPDGKPLGLEVIFTREFFGKDGGLFLRLRKSAEESAAEAGVQLRF